MNQRDKDPGPSRAGQTEGELPALPSAAWHMLPIAPSALVVLRQWPLGLACINL